MQKKPIKVPEMKLIPKKELGEIICDLCALQELLQGISGTPEQPNTADAIRYFLAATTNKLDALDMNACDVRWTV